MKMLSGLMRASILSAACALCGCGLVDRAEKAFGQEPEVRYIRDVIKHAVPLGYAASLAVAAMNGDTFSFVHVIARADSFPSSALIYIDVNAAHPLPVAWQGEGQIVVAGLWEDSAMAIVSVFFSRLNIMQGTFAVGTISTAPLMVDSGKVQIVYAAEDVNAGSDTMFTVSLTQQEIEAEFTRLTTAPPMDSIVNVEQHVWIVQVDPKATPMDLSDDSYTISGVDQYAGTAGDEASVVQVFMILAQMRPSCALNPLSGGATIRNMKASDTSVELGTAIIEFHSACDGRAKIALGTGVYILSSGKTIALNLAN